MFCHVNFNTIFMRKAAWQNDMMKNTKKAMLNKLLLISVCNINVDDESLPYIVGYLTYLYPIILIC